MNAVLALEHQEFGESTNLAGVLTEKQSLFVKFYVELGGQVVKATEAAGYADGRFGYQLQRLPHVQAAIRVEQARLIMGEGASKAVGFMVKALDDAKMSGAVRFQCAKWLAEAAGHGLAAHRAALGLPPSDKPLSEMTLDELDAFIGAGKHAVTKLKEDRARTIEGQLVHSDARSDGVIDAQPVDPQGQGRCQAQPR